MLRTKRNNLSAVRVCSLATVVKCLTDEMNDDKECGSKRNHRTKVGYEKNYHGNVRASSDI